MTEQKDTGVTELSNAQKKYLRKLSHELAPVVYIGKEGLAPTVVEAIDAALTSHELIKVKIINTTKISKDEAAEIVPAKSGSTLVLLVGKTLLLYRKNPKRKKDEQIRLP